MVSTEQWIRAANGAYALAVLLSSSFTPLFVALRFPTSCLTGPVNCTMTYKKAIFPRRTCRRANDDLLCKLFICFCSITSARGFSIETISVEIILNMSKEVYKNTPTLTLPI